MIVPIRLYGDECLKEKAWEVEVNEDNYVALVHDLFDTLEISGSGVGLASTQIGVPLRVFVAIHGDLKSEFINPEILEFSETKVTEEEGCLSIPTISVNVERSDTIKVKYQVIDEKGKLEEKIEEFSGMEARIIQHEIDHLDGICITDKVKGITKTILRPKLKTIVQGRTSYRYPTLHKNNPNYKKLAEEIIDKYIEPLPMEL